MPAARAPVRTSTTPIRTCPAPARTWAAPLRTWAAPVCSFAAWALLAAIGLAAATPLLAADIYDAALQHAGRSADDLKRDSLDRPAEMLRLAGIKPGMRVAAGSSVLARRVDGEGGHGA